MPFEQGVYSDVVLNQAGQPVQGATVALYLVSAFANGVLPTGSPPAPAPSSGPVATAVTDAGGSFSLRGLSPDDYHVLVTYTPPGGVLVTLWRYNVAIGPEGAVSRALRRGLGVPLRRTLALLAAGQACTIVCVGDGVTVGYNATGTVSGGWVARLATRLAGSFPTAAVTRFDPHNYGSTLDAPIPSWDAVAVQAGAVGSVAVVNVVNGGVTADTALRCMRRLANFTAATWFPPPNLYIVYLGLGEMSGDTTRAATAADFAGHLTGLVNLLRAQGAEALLVTPHAGPAPSLGGAFDDYCNAVRAVAAATGCGLADVRQLWLDQYSATAANDGFGTWLNTSGGDHSNPTDSGHQAIGDEIWTAFDLPNELPTAGAGVGVGTELERVLLLNTAPTPLVFSGAWGVGTDANAASGRDFVTSTVGDHLTFNARFSDLYMLCRRWKDSGQVTVTVDGALFGTVDLYRANPVSTGDLGDFNGAIAPRDRLLLAAGLADTVHAVTLTLAATRNAGSAGNTWRFDAVELVRQRQAGQVVEAVKPLQHIESGVASCTLAAAALGGVVVTFAQPYTNGVPQVVATSAFATGDYFGVVGTPTSTGVTVYAARRDGANVTATVPIHWVAIG